MKFSVYFGHEVFFACDMKLLKQKYILVIFSISKDIYIINIVFM